MKYEILADNTVVNTVEASAEFMSEHYPEGNYRLVEEPAPVEPVYTKLTKRAFQERFPLTSNGVSRKYDRMDMFLRDDGYAASLGVTGAGLYELRLLITTGINRLNVSSHVDLALPDAANFLTLLTNPGIPEAFRLTAEERQEMLDAPVRPEERFE